MNAKRGVEALQAPGTCGESGYAFDSRKILPYGMDEILQPLRVLPEFLKYTCAVRMPYNLRKEVQGVRRILSQKKDIHESNANQNKQRAHKKRERGPIHGRRVSHASRKGGFALSMARYAKMSPKSQQKTHLLHLSMSNGEAR